MWLAEPSGDWSPNIRVMGRLNGNSDALPLAVSTDDQVTCSPLLAVSFDAVRMIQHLVNLFRRESMMPELRLIVFVKQKRIEGDRRHVDT